MHPELPLQRLWTFNGTVPDRPMLLATVSRFWCETLTICQMTMEASVCNPFPLTYTTATLRLNQMVPVRLLWANQVVRPALSERPRRIRLGHPPLGDINESMSTLWYHDHRVDFTAQNVYKGLAGFYLLFNQFDTGDETTGFRLRASRILTSP